MLGVTTNQANAATINNAVADYCASGGISSAGGYRAAHSMDDEAELLLEEELMMDPLFEEDWLQENNLDILFDLFEEEIESKVGADSNNGSSTLFGTSPVTSYLLGNSPTLASTLDLIYFDNQQQPLNQQQQLLHHQHQQLQQQQLFQQQQLTAGVHAMNVSSYNNTSIAPAYIPAAPTIATPATHNITNSQATPIKHIAAAPTPVNKSKTSGNGRAPKSGGAQQVNRLTNAMRIKRGLKKGQSEGTSLLAKPCSSNSGSKSSGGLTCSNCSSSCNSKNASKINDINSRNKFNNLATTTTSKNISDKTSAKVTNFKSSIIIGNANNNEMKRNGIDINYSKQSQQLNRERYYLHKCQQHVHYITGRSVIQEHAYAVRGH